jgi:hypothetical protein
LDADLGFPSDPWAGPGFKNGYSKYIRNTKISRKNSERIRFEPMTYQSAFIAWNIGLNQIQRKAELMAASHDMKILPIFLGIYLHTHEYTCACP